MTRFGNTVRLAVDAPVETNVTEERHIVVELTAGIIDRPFNDGLFLSNRSQATYTNTLGSVVTLNADDYVDIAAPDVQICKGISGTTNASSVAVAGAPCAITGVPNNDLTNVDASDVLTYTITARNVGSARAYGVVISDNVTSLPQATDCTLVSVLNGSGAALAYTGTFPNLTLTNPLPTIGSVGVTTAQATAVVTYRCTVATNITPISDPVINQASVAFAAFSDTLPGGPHVNPPTVLFPPRTDVASFTTTAPNITKTRTPATATIGDLITYTLTVDIPGGTMNNVTIVDTLDAGLAFVDCTGVSVTAGNINSSVGAINTATFCNDPVNPVIAAGGGIATWNFGSLTDPGSNNNDLDTITITYTAVVLNTAANVRGQDRNNSAVLGWDNPAGGRFTDSASAPDTRLIEPTLEVDKSVAPASNRDANDLVTFTLIVRHAAGSNATAHNIELSDVIPAGLTYVAGSLTNTDGVAPATLTEAAGTITATWTSLTTAQTSTLQYQARLVANVQPAQTITNTANINWTSLPGSPTNTTYNSLGVERTGNPADVGGAANTYRASDIATVTVGNPSAAKTVTATSLADTGNGADTDPDLTIGEEVTYQITITFREGLTRNAVIRDNLPTGIAVLGYVSSRIVSIGSNLSFSTATPAVELAGTTSDTNLDSVLDRVDWSLSDVTNVADNVVTAADTIVVEVVARVIDVAANSGLAPTQDLNVVNTAQIRYTNFAGTTVAQNGTTTVDIVEPRLTIDKSANVTDADAGDTVTYTVVVRNTGTAPAYNVVITDPLLPQLELLAGTVTTSAGTITTGNSAADTTIRVDTTSLAVNGVITITYQARLRPSVFPGQQLVNTATQTSNSLPDGTGRSGTSSDPATVVVILPQFNKDIVSTSEGATSPGIGTTNQYTAAPDLAIGETITYQMTITVPEGTSNTLRLVDTLPSTGAGDPGTLAYISSRVVSIGANISNSALAVGAPGAVAGQAITFNFVGGTPIANTADGISNAADQIVVEVVARVSNIAANVTGDLLTNRARLTYDGGNTLDASADADVVEPNLNIDKTASPSTNLNAGDVITYTLVITHTAASRADAFDLRISDTIPAGLTYVAGSLTNSAGVAGTLDASGAPTLVITWDTIPLTGSSTITYQVTVNNGITHAQSLTNTANLGYSSLDDGTPDTNDPNERTYTDSDPATVTTNLAPLSFTKSVIDSSGAYTGAGQHGAALPDLTIGETVTYELRARLQEGTTPVTITDTLPAGLTFISTQLAPTNGANVTITNGFPAPTLVGQVMTLALGNVVNAADNIANAADDLVIWVVARASDVPANVGTTGADKINTATLNWGGGTLTDTETVEIVEPNLNIDKTASPTSGLNAGDTVTYTLVITHTGTSTADAFDLRITDTLPAGILYGSVTAVSSTCDERAGWSVDTAGLPGTVIYRMDDLPLTATCTITYTATIANTVVNGTSLTNTAALRYSSLDDGTPDTNDANERVYNDNDPATVTTDVAPLSFTKTVIDTSEAYTGAGQHGATLPDLTIGETVIYELRARLQEGTTLVIITDTLPAGLTFISTQLAPTNGANVTITNGFPAPTLAGQVMTLTLGNVVNAGDNVANTDDDLVIWVVARASNLPANNGSTGADKINTATLNWGGGTLTDTEMVEIVEPLLDITKSATPSIGLDAGDIVTYTFSVTHTAAATADGQDVSINDLLPNHMTYVGNVAAVNGPAPTVTNTAPNIIFSWANLPLGSTYTFTFEVRIDPTVGPAESLTNTATLGWSTLPGGDPNERTYTDTASAVVTTRPPSMEKTIFATSLTETGSGQHNPAIVDVNIGETVTYHMTITMPEGTAPLTLTDNLPDVMTVVSSQVYSLGGNITAGLAVGTAGVTSDSNFADGLPDRVVFNLGTVRNTPDGVENANDQIVLEVVARVDENALNQNGDQLTNTATLDYGTGSVSDTETVEVVEPELNIDKSALVVTGRPGDIIEYTIVVEHSGTSNTAAYDVVITDPLLPDLDLIVGSVTSTRGTVITGNTAGDTTLRIEVGTLNPGATITITYRAQISPLITPPVTFINTATLNYDSAPGPGGRPGTDDDTHTIRVNDDLYRYSKTVVDTSLADTGDSQLTSAPDVTIGERMTFHIEAYLPEGTTTNFTITDNLPYGLIVVSSRVVSIGGNLTTTTLAVGDPGVHSNSNYTADAFDDRVVFSFGDTINIIDGVDNALDMVLVEVEARVYDNALLNRGGETVTNEALIDYGPNQRRTEADVDIIEPNIDLTKTFIPRIEGRGHILAMTLDLVNNGTSIAYKVALNDPWNPGLCLNDVTVDVSGAPGTTFTDSSTSGCGGIIQVDFNQLAVGARVLVTVELTIDPALEPIPQDIPNTATVTYQSIPVGHPDESEARQYRDEATDVLRVDEPTIEMTKVGTPQSVHAGGLLTYTVTVTNTGEPPIDAFDAVITDVLPDVLTFVSATSSKGRCSASGQVVTCMLDRLLRGETITIVIETRVSSSAAGTRILNRVGLTTLEGVSIEAEAPNVVADFTVCSVGCPDIQLYHSDQTGDWEIFRLVGGVEAPADADINLTQNPADDVEPSQSPDGQWMTFASNRDGNWEIYVTPTDGDPGSARRVTYNTFAVDTDPAWGPTDFLVYESTRDGNWELYLLDLRTGTETRLTNNPADDLNAQWSPDGTRLVFQSNRSGRWQLYELNLVTANLRVLSDSSGDDMDASYSNTGDRIVFRSVNGDGTVISIMNADGSGRMVVSDRSSRAANPVWSPDDTLIAYQSDLDGDLDIYIYGVGVGQTRKLTENGIDDYAPTWLCDSLRVMFTSDAPDNPDIFQAEALPLTAPAINVLEEADQLTIDPNQDIYPQGAPSEENASLEGTLPDTISAEPGHTQIMNLDVAVTPQDRTLNRDEVWEAITGCVETDLTSSPPSYALNLFPVP
ncbi:MAG: isopeptide-forming domain-containing fimbrial protein [Chloroflexi bacterium]|uniref:isopeptide-forming domain-containing fimbrial protein n=1 Tax=Candidatus Flexifilum breve TaxID=3140694 RepID=UPI003136B575|nr:isopeptide-forming domain-containing fimbrial protein [Chloroflexota bacterium]